MVLLREAMCPGLDAAVLRDLRAADVKTVEDLVCCDTEELAQRTSLSYKSLVAIRRVLLAQHSAFPVSGADLYEELMSCTAILSTGNPSLDKLLDSGLHTGEVTELVGGPGSGKTQVCVGVAAQVSQRLRQSVVFVDTRGAAWAGRLLQMLRAQSQDGDQQTQALHRIHVLRLFDIFALLDCLFELRAGRLQQVAAGGGGSGSVRALIVDSVSAVLAPLLGGKHSQALSLMSQLAMVLKSIAKDFNLAVLVTNHASRSSSGQLQPSLGAFWTHVPRTRVLLEQPAAAAAAGSGRTATLIKSSRQPCLLTEELDLRWWSGCEDGASTKRKLEQTDS